MADHSFCVEDAVKYGIEKAIILKNMRFWLDKNKANSKHENDGFYWTYNSSKAFAVLFPYMKERSITRWLNELEEEGILKVGTYNQKGYDRTKWYTIPSEYAIGQNGRCISQNGRPIPDSKPDSKPDEKQLQETVVVEWPDYVTSEMKSDIAQLRKNAKAPLTTGAKKGIIKQFNLAIEKGYTIEQCMEQWNMAGWRSFQHDWLKIPPANQSAKVLTMVELAKIEQTEEQKNNNIQKIKGLRA